MEKAKYFSDDDWSIGRALERAEKVLEEYERGAQCSDINSALELYNIQKLFQIGAKLPEWSEEYFCQLTQNAAGHSSTIGAFWKTVEDKNFAAIYENTEKIYKDNFWEEFEQSKAYRRVSKETFRSFLKTQKPSVTYTFCGKRKLCASMGSNWRNICWTIPGARNCCWITISAWIKLLTFCQTN